MTSLWNQKLTIYNICWVNFLIKLCSTAMNHDKLSTFCEQRPSKRGNTWSKMIFSVDYFALSAFLSSFGFVSGSRVRWSYNLITFSTAIFHGVKYSSRIFNQPEKSEVAWKGECPANRKNRLGGCHFEAVAGRGKAPPSAWEWTHCEIIGAPELCNYSIRDFEGKTPRRGDARGGFRLLCNGISSTALTKRGIGFKGVSNYIFFEDLLDFSRLSEQLEEVRFLKRMLSRRCWSRVWCKQVRRMRSEAEASWRMVTWPKRAAKGPCLPEGAKNIWWKSLKFNRLGR